MQFILNVYWIIFLEIETEIEIIKQWNIIEIRPYTQPPSSQKNSFYHYVLSLCYHTNTDVNISKY